MSEDALDLLRKLFDAAVRAASPQFRLAPFLPDPVPGLTRVVGAGKAAASMARAFETAAAANWPDGLARIDGLVVTRYGHGVPTERIEVIEAGHPLPDTRGTQAAARVAALATGLGPEDQLVVLLSGGGSALLAAPRSGLSLEDKRQVSQALLRCGASINEINCVRKHLSAIKGGRLAALAAPARVTTLAISDVVGDLPDVIASGPTVGDTSTRAQALAVLRRYGVVAPPAVMACLADPGCETPKPSHPIFSNTRYAVIARPADALAAAAELAREAGITPVLLGDRIEGEACEVAKTLAAVALACQAGCGPAAPPCVLISGGETTVTLPTVNEEGGALGRAGRGGRNSEFLLALGLTLGDAPGIYALAADTDGIDGSENNAGALIAPGDLQRAASEGCNPEAALARHDAYGFFEQLGRLLHTGPTRTNVNDFRAILVLH